MRRTVTSSVVTVSPSKIVAPSYFVSISPVARVACKILPIGVEPEPLAPDALGVWINTRLRTDTRYTKIDRTKHLLVRVAPRINEDRRTGYCGRRCSLSKRLRRIADLTRIPRNIALNTRRKAPPPTFIASALLLFELPSTNKESPIPDMTAATRNSNAVGILFTSCTPSVVTMGGQLREVDRRVESNSTARSTSLRGGLLLSFCGSVRSRAIRSTLSH